MRHHTNRCPVCEKLFFPVRIDAVYCSAKCRQRAKRRNINNSKDETQSIYNQSLVNIRKLQSHNAQRYLKSLAISIIQSLDDTTRESLYMMLDDDMNRVIRDNKCHR